MTTWTRHTYTMLYVIIIVNYRDWGSKVFSLSMEGDSAKDDWKALSYTNLRITNLDNWVSIIFISDYHLCSYFGVPCH